MCLACPREGDLWQLSPFVPGGGKGALCHLQVALQLAGWNATFLIIRTGHHLAAGVDAAETALGGVGDIQRERALYVLGCSTSP